VDVSTEQPIPFFRPLGLALTATAAAFVAILVAGLGWFALSGRGPAAVAALKNPGSDPLQTVALFAYVVMAAVLLWRWPRIMRRTPHELGLRGLRPRDWATAGIGIAAVYALRFLTGLALSLTHNTHHVQTGFEHFRVTDAYGAAVTAATAVIAAPFTEELLFRGVIFSALWSRLPVVVAAALSALLFGLIHNDGVLFPAIAGLGFINALVYARSGNLYAAMIVHAANNLLPIVFLIAYGT
jgi:membrane protease YdiL (CAAX protease family)